MATNSSKQQCIDKSFKITYKALKELEKYTPRKNVARIFEVPKNTLSTWKNTKKRYMKTKIEGLEQHELNVRSMEPLTKPS